jgi:hypothetical protein
MTDPMKQDGSVSSLEEEVAPINNAVKKEEVGRIVDDDDVVVVDPTTTPYKTYRERALENGMKYTVTDVPPLSTSLLLGAQHYLTMLGATVLIPLLLCPAMGANGNETAEVISSIFFVSGINTVSVCIEYSCCCAPRELLLCFLFVPVVCLYSF